MYPEAVVHRCSIKKVPSRFCQLHRKLSCRSLFFNKVVRLKPPAFNFIKEETPALVSSSEFRKAFGKTYFDNCSYILSELFITANFSFGYYDVTDPFIISFISE